MKQHHSEMTANHPNIHIKQLREGKEDKRCYWQCQEEKKQQQPEQHGDNRTESKTQAGREIIAHDRNVELGVQYR
jgi:hypothetical protein